jgi:hypothetical protein
MLLSQVCFKEKKISVEKQKQWTSNPSVQPGKFLLSFRSFLFTEAS